MDIAIVDDNPKDSGLLKNMLKNILKSIRLLTESMYMQMV